MKKKFVIANYGSGNTGKTTSLKEVYFLIKSVYPNATEAEVEDGTDRDIRSIISITDSFKIGIETKGDPYSRLGESLELFLRYECGIIIVACRTKGDSREKVRALWGHNYDIIWAQHYQSNQERLRDELNQLYAKNILEIIQKIESGIIK